MNTWQQILGQVPDAVLILVAGIIVVLVILYAWHPTADKHQAAEMRKSEGRPEKRAVRSTASTELDTSQMLPVPMTEGQRELCKNDGGTFGSRYVHLYVIDRSGQAYVCMMTEYNMHALWQAGFKHGPVEPTLCDHYSVEPLVVDGYVIEAYPAILRGKQNTPAAKEWVGLHKLAGQQEGGPRVYNRYFDEYGKPRLEPFELTAW